MTYFVNPKTKKEEKALEAALKELSIGFYTDEHEDAAFLKAIEKSRKSRLLSAKEKTDLLRKLKIAK